MLTDAVDGALDALGVRPVSVTLLKDAAEGNGNWLVEVPGGQRAVLRRYHPGAIPEEIAYEHAVLAHLAAAGWAVPHPVSELTGQDGRWYCLTRYIPGQPIESESPAQQARRGRDLARLHLALRELGDRLGQRPGWRPQHTAVTVHADIDWDACVRGLAAVSPRLGAWTRAAADRSRDALAAIGAGELPVMVLHGDFAEWNVHCQQGGLAGVIDFGLTHLDSRPYELAIARTYRAPHVIGAYRGELARHGWPLSALEEAVIIPIYQAFRLDMTAWEMASGRKTGNYDLAAIERQLSRTGTPCPLGRLRGVGAGGVDGDSPAAVGVALPDHGVPGGQQAAVGDRDRHGAERVAEVAGAGYLVGMAPGLR
jgi:Ser/Thr protein kinase RdoA (MazF antagonist)